jgi:hypothetical protein
VNLPGGAAAAGLFLEAILEDLPYILSHLRGDSEAMTLEQVVNVAEGAEEADAVDTPSAPPIRQPKGKGLNAEEFAAFLKRGEPDEG